MHTKAENYGFGTIELGATAPALDHNSLIYLMSYLIIMISTSLTSKRCLKFNHELYS